MIARLALYTPLDPSFVGGIRSWADAFLKPYCESRRIRLRLIHTRTRPASESGAYAEAKQTEVDTCCIPGLAMPVYRGRVPSPKRLRRELEGVDLVYFDNGYALQDLAVLAATRSTGVPVVSGFHSVIKSGNVLHDATWALVGKTALRRFDAVHALNAQDAAYLCGLGARNVMNIPLAVDGHAFAPGRLPERFRITFLGRLHPQKGIDTLVRLVALLHERLPSDVEFSIAGDGPLREDLSPLRSLRRVAILGSLNRRDAATLLGQSAVVLMPSRCENFPNVAAEATSAGALVVATDVSGLRDIVQEQGVLVPVRMPIDAWHVAVQNAYRQWFEEPAAFERRRAERHANAMARYGFEAVSSQFDELLARASRSQDSCA